MKTAIIFIAIALVVFVGVYTIYVSTGGTPLEELFNQAVGLQDGEEEGGGGLPIVVSLVPYIAIIAVLVGVGVILHVAKKRHDNTKRFVELRVNKN